MPEAIGFSKWVFELTKSPIASGNPTNYQVTILGTISPRAYAYWKWSENPELYAQSGYATSQPPVPFGGDWFVLPSPSDQTGAGVAQNPLTNGGTFLYCSLPLVAVRAVLTGNTGATSAADVIGFAVP